MKQGIKLNYRQISKLRELYKITLERDKFSLIKKLAMRDLN